MKGSGFPFLFASLFAFFLSSFLFFFFGGGGKNKKWSLPKNPIPGSRFASHCLCVFAKRGGDAPALLTAHIYPAG